MWVGQLVTPHVADQSFAPPDTNKAIVIEHHDTVGREPGVALQSRRTEPQRQRERVERVLAGVCAGTAMGEADRPLEQRRQPLLHSGR